jgi:glycosyltransferase involved in cell wall biosynthesis
MANREKIALTYFYSENWIAGSYYVVNIIEAFNSLPDEEKPYLYVIIDKTEGLHLVQAVKYPYLRLVNLNQNDDGLIVKYLRKISNRLFKSDLIFRRRLSGVQHVFEGSTSFNFIPRHYYWVHDFQQLRLPGFFTPEEAASRSALPARVAKLKGATLILSSRDALNDFNTYFPGYLCDVRVLRFASSLPDLSAVDLSEEKQKFGITAPYFLCSNQFWQHKNHRLVLEAINLLKNKGLEFHVLFTGKPYDFRNPTYFTGLEAFVRENELERWVKFLGFIDRKVQVALARNAICYIQPSLFEGWSTTVEDAKFLNKYVLLSDIPVHREQLDYNVTFFNPADAAELASHMETFIKTPPTTVNVDYRQNIKAFGKDLIETFS